VSVSGPRGNLTTVTAQANASTSLFRKYTYYNTGMLHTSTDVSTSSTTNGAATTYNYSITGNADCGNSFVTSITEPVASMSRSFTWDCNGGVLLSVVDENGKNSSTAYNGTGNVFWRPSSTTDEAGTVTTYSYKLTATTPPVEFQTEAASATFNAGNSIVDRVTTNDGFGRGVFSQTWQGPAASNYDTVATCYDTFGRVSLTTLPYSAALATSTSSCPSTNAGTAVSYDELGRTSSTGDNFVGGGSTAFSYNKNDTTETRSSPTVSKQSEFDGLGRLSSVCEITTGTTAWPSAACNPPQNTAATGYLTKYGYDVLGNRISVIQNSQTASNNQSRTYAYDMLGRLTSETNPEMNNTATTYSYDSLSSDAACGTINSAGNLLKRLDAAGNATCSSSYDALHRVGIVTYPPSSTPAKHFIYDVATVNSVVMSNVKTRLAEAYTCIGTCSSKLTDLGFSYDAVGRQTDFYESTPDSAGYYHVVGSYWPNGN
jgi:YD repeat-containing protein